MSQDAIPFNKPYMTGRELGYIAEAHANGHLSGDGPFTRRCHALFEQKLYDEMLSRIDRAFSRARVMQQ